jgi:glucans biosynthesis protein C
MMEQIQSTDTPQGAAPFDGRHLAIDARPNVGASSEATDSRSGFGSGADGAVGGVRFGTVGVMEKSGRSRSSVALGNLRALVILTVLAFHSVLAYLGSLGTAAFPFDDAPYKWRAFPIVDSHRWFGFDVFCAWQDVYLMSLMFFLSALFTWPSLTRKGGRRFLSDRVLRLGVPFAFALVVVMPIALYPVYRMSAVDPSLIGYGRHYLALPFWPNGPMWFLWLLLALTGVAAGLHRFVPHWVAFLARCSSSAAARPGRYFIGLAVACTLGYVPLALAFTPWDWSNHGPLALQLSRPLLYAVMYFAGLGVGAYGLERGLLASDGMLARRWAVWFAGALAAFLFWMGLTALAMSYTPSAPLSLRIAVDGCFAVACASGCCFVMAGCLRFATMRSRVLASLADNAFGIYLLHYVFVVWLQYALLGVALFAIMKAMIVFGGTLLLAWATAVAMRLVPLGSRLIGAERLVLAPSALSPGNPTESFKGGLAGNLTGSLAGNLAGGLVRERELDSDRGGYPPPSLVR